MTSTNTSTNSNTMISRSKLLDISDLNSYFTSSLFLLFGLADGGNNGGTSIAGNENDAIITVDEDNNSSIFKYLVIVYQRIIRNVSISSNTVQLLFDFATTIYLGINSTNSDDNAAIVLSPAAHLLGFGYKHTSSSKGNVGRHRRNRRLRILLYAFLRIVLPKLYEIMKRKGIEYYVNNNKEEEDEEEQEVDVSSPLTLQLSHQHEQQKQEEEMKEVNDGNAIIQKQKNKLKLKQISLNRKKLLLQKIIQFIDTTIPIIRLLLLLSCWNTNTKQNTNTNQYGGNVSMFLSGLSYTTTATSANTMSSSPPLPIASSSLFVLYAHRRWFHREFVNLLWNRIGRSLITISSEINDMLIPFYQKQKQYLLFLYKQKILSRYYKNKNKDRIIKATINNNNYDDENKNDVDDNENDDNANDCCQLCNTTNVIIPYRFIDCCQQIVCYTCLWNYIVEYNNNSNNNHNNHNTKNSHNDNNHNTKITIPCPICYQDIQHCQPV